MKINSYTKRLVKAGRIAGPDEIKAVGSAKIDVGHLKKVQYSRIAQRRVPKALHSIYGLPMRDHLRPKNKQKDFIKKQKS